MNIKNEQDFVLFFQRAEKFREKGQLKEAAKIYLSLAQYRLDSGSIPQTGYSNYDIYTIERLSDLCQLTGFTRVSESLLSGLIQIYQQYQKTYLFLHCVLKKAHLQLQEGHFENCFETLQYYLANYVGDLHEVTFLPEALQEWEQEAQFLGLSPLEKIHLYANLYFVLGSLMAGLGQYADSLNAFDRGIIHITGPLAQSQSLLELLQLGKLQSLVEIGSLNQAKDLFDETERESVNLSLTSGAKISYMNLKAKFYLLRGSFSDALAIMDSMITLCTEHHLFKAAASGLLNLAHAQILLNQLSKAEENIFKALSFVEKKAPDIVERGRLLLELVGLRGQSSLGPMNPSSSINNLNREQTQEVELDFPFNFRNEYTNYLVRFEDRVLSFQLLLADQQFERAKVYLENIRQVFDVTDSALIKNRLEVSSIMLSYYLNQSIGQSQPEQITKYFVEESLLPELWQFQRILSWTDIIGHKAKEALIESNNRLLNTLGNSLSQEDNAIFMLNKWTSDEEYLAILSDQMLYRKSESRSFSLLKPLQWLKLGSRIFYFLQCIDRYKLGLLYSTITESPRNAQFIHPHGLWWKLIKHLACQSKDTISIAYTVLPDRLVICYYTFIRIGFKVVKVNRIHLRQAIRHLHEIIHQGDTSRSLANRTQLANKTNSFMEIIERLSKILQIESILSNTSNKTKRINFFPDDSLNGLPFAILSFKNKYLVKQFALKIQYRHFLSQKKAKPNEFPSNLLVGISDYIGAPLPGVKREIKNLTEHFKSEQETVTVLENKAATKENIFIALKSSRTLHIACHGFFNHNQPDATGLLLFDNEILSLKDILNSPNFQHLEHVTLSSCWAADHFIMPGRWVISLPETLWRSGVNSILGCLWEVNDRFAVSFMRRFYHYAKVFPKDIALQKTQVDAIEQNLQSGKSDQEPIFNWCAFNLYGG